MGVRRRFWGRFHGVPRGLIGRIGIRVMAPAPRARLIAEDLDLQPDDEVLDVGCGAGLLLAEHAAHVRYAAGLDASELMVGMARERLAERIAAGTAEIILGDAAALPWDDERFTVATSLEVLKHVSDPEAVLREMYRVLRPAGRARMTMGEHLKAPWGSTDESGVRDAWGIWSWSDADARRLVEEAGFAEVSVSVMPVRNKARLVSAVKPAGSGNGRVAGPTAPIEEVVP